jgi:periplasmic divalent cation tolerance protein
MRAEATLPTRIRAEYPACVSNLEAKADADDAEPWIVLLTAPDMRVAEDLARELVGSGALACANLVDGVKSIYRWKGSIEVAGEVLVLGKTTRARAADVERCLARAHPYEVPECVFVAPSRVEAKYLRWLVDETRATRSVGG